MRREAGPGATARQRCGQRLGMKVIAATPNRMAVPASRARAVHRWCGPVRPPKPSGCESGQGEGQDSGAASWCGEGRYVQRQLRVDGELTAGERGVGRGGQDGSGGADRAGRTGGAGAGAVRLGGDPSSRSSDALSDMGCGATVRPPEGERKRSGTKANPDGEEGQEQPEDRGRRARRRRGGKQQEETEEGGKGRRQEGKAVAGAGQAGAASSTHTVLPVRPSWWWTTPQSRQSRWTMNIPCPPGRPG